MVDWAPNNYGSWRTELERIEGHAERGFCLDSDGSGLFLKKIGDFLEFVLQDGKGNDPDIKALRNFLAAFRPDLCRQEELKKSQIEILNLCLNICRGFEKQPAA